jgi:hypothetical protein
MISNLEQMKEHLNKIKSQASGCESTDGSYEACLHAMGYYALQQNIKSL